MKFVSAAEGNQSGHGQLLLKKHDKTSELSRKHESWYVEYCSTPSQTVDLQATVDFSDASFFHLRGEDM